MYQYIQDYCSYWNGKGKTVADALASWEWYQEVYAVGLAMADMIHNQGENDEISYD